MSMNVQAGVSSQQGVRVRGRCATERPRVVVRGDAVSVRHGHQDVREIVGDRYRRDTRNGDQDDSVCW